MPPPREGASGVPHMFVTTAYAAAASKNMFAYHLRNYDESHAADGVPFDVLGANDWSVNDMALATAAAPSFFSSHEHAGVTYVDGGLAANNPTLNAVLEARSLWPDRPIGAIVSLGCGKTLNRSEASNGVFYWLGQVDCALSMLSARALTLALALLFTLALTLP